MLWKHACCASVHVVQACMLCKRACCGSVHVVEACMLWKRACKGACHFFFAMCTCHVMGLFGMSHACFHVTSLGLFACHMLVSMSPA